MPLASNSSTITSNFNVSIVTLSHLYEWAPPSFIHQPHSPIISFALHYRLTFFFLFFLLSLLSLHEYLDFIIFACGPPLLRLTIGIIETGEMCPRIHTLISLSPPMASSSKIDDGDDRDRGFICCHNSLYQDDDKNNKNE